MKKVNLFLLVLPVAMLAYISCSKDGNSPDHPVEVQFQLLNEAGEPATSFREGEDIIFDYKMINTHGEDIVWYDNNHSGKPVYPVFGVYHDMSGDVTLVGHTHEPDIFFTRWGSTMSPSEPVIIRVTWLGNIEKTKITWGSIKHLGNSTLPKGKYVVMFEHAIQFAQFNEFHTRFHIPFEVF